MASRSLGYISSSNSTTGDDLPNGSADEILAINSSGKPEFTGDISPNSVHTNTLSSGGTLNILPDNTGDFLMDISSSQMTQVRVHGDSGNNEETNNPSISLFSDGEVRDGGGTESWVGHYQGGQITNQLVIANTSTLGGGISLCGAPTFSFGPNGIRKISPGTRALEVRPDNTTTIFTLDTDFARIGTFSDNFQLHGKVNVNMEFDHTATTQFVPVRFRLIDDIVFLSIDTYSLDISGINQSVITSTDLIPPQFRPTSVVESRAINGYTINSGVYTHHKLVVRVNTSGTLAFSLMDENITGSNMQIIKGCFSYLST